MTDIPPGAFLRSGRRRMSQLLTVGAVLFLASLTETAGAGDFSPQFPETGGYIRGYNAASVRQSLRERPIHRIEGIWQLTDGMIVAIERLSRDEENASSGSFSDLPGSQNDAIAIYRMAVVSSPVRSVRPGTVIGHLAPTAKNGVYEGQIFTSLEPRMIPARPKKLTVSLESSGDRFVISHPRTGMRFSLRHAFPWLFRPTVSYSTDGREPDHYGAMRLYPAPATPLEPVYL